MKQILFNTAMVRAILDGTKTVTRRVAFPARDLRPFRTKSYPNGWWFRGRVYAAWDNAMRSPQGVMSECRYRPGDILYVREAWAAWSRTEGIAPTIHYKADDEKLPGCKWRPSIHMPREAARIFLRVVDVRVERLQDISDEQALKEGIPEDSDYPLESPIYCPLCKGEGLIGTLHSVSLGYMEVDCPNCDTPVKRFANLWNSTIKPADQALYDWNANPWVWVIGFERISKEEAKA